MTYKQRALIETSRYRPLGFVYRQVHQPTTSDDVKARQDATVRALELATGHIPRQGKESKK